MLVEIAFAFSVISSETMGEEAFVLPIADTVGVAVESLLWPARAMTLLLFARGEASVLLTGLDGRGLVLVAIVTAFAGSFFLSFSAESAERGFWTLVVPETFFDRVVKQFVSRKVLPSVFDGVGHAQYL